ncbi:restriction endonuclease [Pseudomonas proteolytica]|uniref:restriction endonuclease n=1 Tax=Pseudomonas proteolytica TaxID=219574 RepID=UPI0014742D35|nr:restriction endonuclease [Pseudomonas proteolytica]NMZ24450.1 restriction endonuclease [Pseudomonas proteolytica]
MHWAEYQQKAADFFITLGLKTEIECKIHGVRGSHNIDVLASGTFGGVNFKWIVECKAWKRNIPKEKVMALSAIVQDVGADRGILLSEVGFQSGAILSARSSNITLTSLEDLSRTSEQLSIDAIVGKVNWEAHKARSRLLEEKRRSDWHEYSPSRLMLSSELGILELLLSDALQGKYPISYPTKGLQWDTLESLIGYAEKLISKANSWDISQDLPTHLPQNLK